MRLPLLFSLFLSILVSGVNAQIPSGSVLWLRADQQVITGTGNKVTNWNDVSGNNNNVSQSNTANQPVLIQNVFGNMPSVLFDGVNGKYFLNNTTVNLVPAGSPRTIFVVGKMDCAAVANGGGTFPGGGGTLFTFRRSTPIFGVQAVTVSPYGNFVYTGGLSTFSNETVADDFINTSKFTFVHTYISNGTGSHLQLRQNGQPVVVTPQSPCGSLSSCDPAVNDNGTIGFTVGDREDIIGQDWQGYISEIIVYPSLLSAADIVQVEQYLSNKYFLSTGAPFTGITTIPKDNSTNINIEGDWKHSYNINTPSNIIASIKDTCNIQGIRIDTVYNEAINSINTGPYKFMRRHYTIKYSNGPTGIKKVRLYFSDADFSALQTAIPGLTSLSQLAAIRYSGPTENSNFDTSDATQLQHFSTAEVTTGNAYNNNYIELNTYNFGEFWIYAVPLNTNCNNWLHLPSNPSFVSVGDLDVSGTTVTVEAVFYQTGTADFEGDIVSKHNSPADINYLLRANHAYITTSDGYFATPDICTAELNRRYHIAMVYDGSILKFYRNGFLMSEVNATGTLFQNNWATQVGLYAPQFWNSNFLGYVNEVRIWNVARSQAQIQSFMNTSLPNPSTQTGLLAYYAFDNLLNKQGNTAWNGTANGSAVINSLVPVCTFEADSCSILPNQQTCSGSLGNPIVNITFGSGTTNPGPQISVAVPGATTNYNFASYATGTTPSPPIDGDYALVNVVPFNSAWYTGAKDHTGNPDGYMAFFNSAPTPGDFYRQTVNNLCPGTTYEFAAWVANVINPSILPGAILPNITFKILDPVTQSVLASYNTGDIPNANAMTWRQYSFLFTAPAGSSSVTLVLANNNIGGSAQPGNDLAIDDITFKPCGPLTKASFSSTTQVDSTGATSCSSINLFGNITGSFNDPSYQWQISNDEGISFSNISGASNLNAAVSNLTPGEYTIRLLSAEAGNINSSNCSFISNLLKITVTNCADTVINSYAAVLSIDICTNSVTADDITGFNVGDTIVIMQMKGASIDSSNSSNFGSITNHNNAGKYEFNYIKAINGNTIVLLNTLLNKYDAAKGKVQLIRVPYFPSLTVNNTLSCLAWDGSKGGVLIVNSATEVNLNAPVNVSGKGFRGGAVGAGFSCGNTDLWAIAAPAGGSKGEGITEDIPGLDAGGGRLSTGGGGAYAANSGGGGGGNYGAGGFGGAHSNTCPVSTQSMQGEAGDYSAANRVFAGGGGGGGQQDDGQPVAPGGNGGGIVIIKAFTLNGNNQSILANGESISTLVRDEGGAGGGAGGSVLLFVNGYAGNLFIETNGGDGSSNENVIYPSRCHGPGGGGGGGFTGSSLTVLPPFVTVSANGGTAGLVGNAASPCFNTSYNATNGEPGGSLFNLVLPEATVPFVKNIDSVRIKDSSTSCKSFDFKGIAYINNHPIQKWEWDFGNGQTDTLQNTSQTYNSYGNYTVKLVVTDSNGCKDSTTKQVTTSGINFDFVFAPDSCNPLSVAYRAVGDSTADIYWSLGDGTVVNNTRNPIHLYADTGFYLVQYSTGNTGTGCIDTVKKIIFIGYRYDNIILTPDTTICAGGGKDLRSNIDTSLQFCWSPYLYLEDADPANPRTIPPGTITYALLAESESNNMITNGDFSAGDNGFTSGYTSGVLPLAASSYFIGASSTAAGPGTSACSDHSSGSGNMLMARNTAAANGTVWQQTVPVSPNTTYQFSAFIQSLKLFNNSLLELAINGNRVLENITPGGTCNWQKHAVLWNSGNNSTVTLAIQNKANNSGIDDYFAIDDIKFAPYSIKKDTIRITVDSPVVQTRTDTAVCESIPVILNTTGAATYSWTPVAGLSNPAAESPVATPDITTTYFVTGTNNFGCTAADSVTVFINPAPVISSTGDTTICTGGSATLFASGGTSYAWEPSMQLNNANIANPVTNPATSNIVYVVTVTGSNNCTSKDSFTVAVKPLPVFSISPDQSVCLDNNAQLSAAGGNYYEWSPAALVSNAGISNPTAVPTSTTQYAVLIRDTVCNNDTTLNTTITVLPLPVITAARSNDVSCANKSSQLTAAGAVSYTWAPAASLNNPASPSPVATPAATTTYTVTGTNAEGCTNTAAVTVIADFSDRSLFLLPNAFSPNGDGINECFGLKYFGQVTQLQFLIYDRWGKLVFATSNPNDCWDGTYKGKPCNPGNFIYYIKAKTNCGNPEKKGNLVLVR